MILRQPNWAQTLETASSAQEQGEQQQQQRVVSPVVELVTALSDQRLYREVVWSLKRGLHDARSEFSFVRVRGLHALAKLVASAAKADKVMELFRDSQSFRELQVVPMLFDYTLAPRKRIAKNLEAGVEVESAPIAAEVTLALRVLEGCCLLYSGCRASASHRSAVSELIDFFLAGGSAVQSTCLDGLLAVMLDSPPNQKEFERVHGLRKIAEMLRNSHLDSDIRLKIAEFIVILMSQVLPNGNRGGLGGGEGPEQQQPAWMSKWAQQELVEILGEESSAVVDKIIDAARQPFSDQGSQQSSMLRYAQELLHLADDGTS